MDLRRAELTDHRRKLLSCARSAFKFFEDGRDFVYFIPPAEAPTFKKASSEISMSLVPKGEVQRTVIYYDYGRVKFDALRIITDDDNFFFVPETGEVFQDRDDSRPSYQNKPAQTLRR